MTQPSPYNAGAERERDAGDWTVRLCRGLRETLNAERVSVWLYDAVAQAVSPFASDREDDPDFTESRSKWEGTRLEDFPAACTVLLEAKPIDTRDASADSRLPPQLAFDLGIASAHIEPLTAGAPVGMLWVEPASAASGPELHTMLPVLAAAAARAQTWRDADRRRAEAEFLLELTETAMYAESLGEMLGILCERIARELGARRTSIFLAQEEGIVPRMSRFADGSIDPDAWRRFRQAAAPLPAVEAVMHSGKPASAHRRSSPLIGEWWADNFAIGSLVAVPLGETAAPIGVVVIDDPREERFTEREVEYAAAIGARVGGLIERTRTSEERAAGLRTAEAIRRLLEEGAEAVSVEQAGEVLARVTAEALGTELAAVLLVGEGARIEDVTLVARPEDARAHELERLVGTPADDLRLWRVATGRSRPILVDDAAASDLLPGELSQAIGLRSYVAYPLLSGELPLGIVLCGRISAATRWDREQRELASQLMLEGTLLVERAVLRASEQERIGELAYRAFHDPLTSLPNRALLADRLEHALARMNRRDESVAVLFLDLDSFKLINDSFGHEAGDRLLIAVAKRLQGCLRPEDTVARLGGDEFTILLEDISDVRYATRVAGRVADALKTPFKLNGHEASITTSVGIAVSGRGANAATLLRNADLAMYRAKATGKARHEFFSPERMAEEGADDRADASRPDEQAVERREGSRRQRAEAALREEPDGEISDEAADDVAPEESAPDEEAERPPEVAPTVGRFEPVEPEWAETDVEVEPAADGAEAPPEIQVEHPPGREISIERAGDGELPESEMEVLEPEKDDEVSGARRRRRLRFPPH